MSFTTSVSLLAFSLELDDDCCLDSQVWTSVSDSGPHCNSNDARSPGMCDIILYMIEEQWNEMYFDCQPYFIFMQAYLDSDSSSAAISTTSSHVGHEDTNPFSSSSSLCKSFVSSNAHLIKNGRRPQQLDDANMPPLKRPPSLDLSVSSSRHSKTYDSTLAVLVGLSAKMEVLQGDGHRRWQAAKHRLFESKENVNRAELNSMTNVTAKVVDEEIEMLCLVIIAQQ